MKDNNMNNHTIEERMIEVDNTQSIAICLGCGRVSEKYPTGDFGAYLTAIAPIMDEPCEMHFNRFLDK